MDRPGFYRAIALVLSVVAAGIGAVAIDPAAAHPTLAPNLRAETVTQTTITIRWDRITTNFGQGQYVLGTNATPDGTWLVRDLTPDEAQARMVVVHSLQANHDYLFSVHHKYDSGCHDPDGGFSDGCPIHQHLLCSDFLCVRTLPATSAPAAPADLHVCGSGGRRELCPGGGTLFYWRDNASTEDHYEFQWALGQPRTPPPESAYTTVWLPANLTSGYRFSPPSSGTYYFRVRACNALCSAFSNVLQVTVPPVIGPRP